MSQKILIVTDNLRDQINGVVTTYKNIESHAGLDGFEFVYIDPGQYPHCSCPGYPEVKLSWPWAIGRKIEALAPDYIHIATEGPLGIAARIYCERRGYKYNTAYHTKFPEYLRKIYNIPASLTYLFVRWFHSKSHRVLTTTQTMVEDLRQHGFGTNVIPWTRGVDRQQLKPTVAHQPAERTRLLYVGRVSREKGLDDLCRLQKIYEIEIVGDGPYRAELEAKYTQVKFLGYQSGTELANSYKRADVFVFPSRSDTFGIVIIEALSVGTPVAAYPVPGPQDILEQGITGHMSESLIYSIEVCKKLNRLRVETVSNRWNWANCWAIFKSNLTKKLN